MATEQARRTSEGLVKKLERHIVDSTAIITEATVPYAAGEVYLAGMSSQVSANARLLGAGLTYCGLGFAFAKGREFSRKLFKVNEDSSEKSILAHDALYNAGFNAVVGPFFYLASGCRDTTEIALGTAMQVGAGFLNGSLMGYAVDVGRDLMGIETCERKSYPNSVRRLSPKVKKTLATLLVAGTIGVTSGIYALNPDNNNSNVPQQHEQVIENDN